MVGDDGLLHATAGACDNGYAWVAAALSSGLAEYSAADLNELAETLQAPNHPTDGLSRWVTDIRSRLDRLAAASVLVHEETHFYQLISTPYGRLVSELERYWVTDLAKLTREAARRRR